MDFKSIANAAMSAAGKSNPSLSADSLKVIDDLVAKGNFKDQSDFMAFATKVYMELRASGSPAQPTQAQVSQAVQDTAVARGMSQQDVQGQLVPLLTSVFTSMGKNQMGI